jgi:type II pantothenate kinase
MQISLDFGITVTDALIKTAEGEIEHRSLLSEEGPKDKIIKNIFQDLDFKQVESIAVTGGRHEDIANDINGIKIVHVNEVQAIGEGAMYLSGVPNNKGSIIVNSGSGTSCIYSKNGDYFHCSGTGVGGGTVLGLSKLLLGTTDPDEINKLASNGDERNVDLIIEDVVSGPIGQLPSDTTAVNFGKIAKNKDTVSREDIAAGIVNLVGQTAARIATSVAFAYEVSDIIVVGRTPTFKSLRESLEKAALLTNFNPHFPENGHYASALGAMLIAEK